METEIVARPEAIDFAPASPAAEIMQNVRTILATPKHSVPLDRLFGIDAVMLDRPMPKAKAATRAEIIAAIRRYEPRCKVTRVTFEGDMDGKLIPRVRIKIDEERLVPGVA
jgi:phage baseplate assembly protein W